MDIQIDQRASGIFSDWNPLSHGPRTRQRRNTHFYDEHLREDLIFTASQVVVFSSAGYRGVPFPQFTSATSKAPSEISNYAGPGNRRFYRKAAERSEITKLQTVKYCVVASCHYSIAPFWI
jgi:hypothetical protein